MTEDEAKAWISERFGKQVAQSLVTFVGLVREEATEQNLISQSSMERIWARHIVDSAQLLALARPDGLWIDIGTGAGFPGLVTAVAGQRRTLLVEPRKRRVAFLQHAIDRLGIGTLAEVVHSRIESVDQTASVISARAVATVDQIFTTSVRCRGPQTQFVLPKGLRAREEVAQAKKSWHGTFHVEHSVTDPESMIVIASGIARR